MGLSKQTKLAIVIGGLVVAMSATAVATAQSPIDPPEASDPPETEVAEGYVGEACFEVFEEEFEGALPQELLDELNAEGADLATALDAAGVDYTLETDDDGVTFPEWDESDEAANAIVDEFFEGRYGTSSGFIAGDGMDLPQELVDDLTAEGTALAAAFDAAGISYEMVTDPAGVVFPEWDWDDEAANEIAEEFFESKTGVHTTGVFIDEMDLPDELVAELNQEAADFAAALDAAGVSYTLETDEMGVTFPEWDESDEAANAVAETFFEDRHAECDDINLAGFEMDLHPELEPSTQ